MYFFPAIQSEDWELVMEFVDCFWDDIWDREFIQTTLWVDHVGMTREKCARYCHDDLDLAYIGLQVSQIL